MSKQTGSFKFFIIMAFVALAFFGGFSLFGYFAGSMFIFYFILGFAVVAFLMMILMAFMMRQKGKQDWDKDRDEIHSKLATYTPEESSGEYKEFAQPRVHSSSGRYRIDAYVITSPPSNELCRISKLPLRTDQDVLQCPSCESYFIKNYLEDWLRENDVCPVCKFKLKITV
ncbi:MAG: hypothetical protein KGD59_13445 [Candidatus Heimdallarchaeota archaeon]|nr:hypothetical protein [Candidatus Heimdallarchaeota archaeon]